MKWFEYAIAIFGAVFLATAFISASSLGGVGVQEESLRVASQNGLEAQLSYSFTQTGVNRWRVDWAWVNDANRLDLVRYRTGFGPRPAWVQEDEVLAADAMPFTVISGGLRASVPSVNETEASGSFELTLSGVAEVNQIKVGLHSAVIESFVTNSSALFTERGRKLVEIPECNGVAVAYINGTGALRQAAVKISVDGGASFASSFNVSLNGSSIDQFTSIVKLSNNNLFVSYGASTHAVGALLAYDGACGWSIQYVSQIAPSRVGYVSKQDVVLTSCSDDSLHLFYLNASGNNNLNHKVCRASVANCSNPNNWNASDNTLGYDLFEGNYSTMSAACDSNNDVTAVVAQYLPPNLYEDEQLFKLSEVSAGVWAREYTNYSIVSRIGYEVLSTAFNSSNALFVAIDNWTSSSGGANALIQFSYCDGGKNCSSTANWFTVGGVNGFETISNVSQTSRRPSLSIVNDTPYVFFDNNGSSVFLNLVYVKPNGAGGWTNAVELTSNDYGNTYATTPWNTSSANVPIAWLNGTASWNLLYNGTPNAVTNLTSYVSYPANATYYGSSINGSYFFTSPNYATANCSVYLDSLFLESNVINRNTVTNHSFLGLSYAQHYFYVYCFNASDSSGAGVNFTMTPHVNTYVAYCLDESTGSPITCSIKASNSTGNYSVAYNAYYLNYSSGPLGSLTITANKSGYYNRTFYDSWDGTVNSSLNVLLLNASSPTTIFVRFHVQNSAYSAVANAFINLTKYIGGVPYYVASAYTDGFGVASFYLDYTTTYTLFVSASGYSSQTLTVTPVLNDYTITLGSGSGGVGINGSYEFPTWCYDNTTVSFIPVSRNLFLGDNYVNASVIARDSNLSYWGWNLYSNDSLVNASNFSSGAGGVLFHVFSYNASNATGNVSFALFWARNSSSQCYAFVSFNVFNMSGAGTGLVDALKDIKASTSTGSFAFQLIILLVTAVIIAFAARYTAVGGAIIGALVVTFFALGGWIAWEVWLTLVLFGLLASYFIFSRGY